MSLTRRRTVSDDAFTDEVDGMVAATRVLGELIAESLAGLEPPLTMPQWRVLVLAAESDCNVSRVAQDLGVHMSNATRVCDRLVTYGLIERHRADQDRRRVLLRHTAAGRTMVDRAMQYRRSRIEEVMELMDAEDRACLAPALTSFLEAATRARVEQAADGRTAV